MDQVVAQPRLDTTVAKVVAGLPPLAVLKGMNASDISTVRATIRSNRPSDEVLKRGGDVSVVELSVPGASGQSEVSLLVLSPSGGTHDATAVYFIHGGGLVAGDNRTSIEHPLDWVLEHGIVLISVEYRLAPEHPYPAALEDCYAGLEWIAQNAAAIGISPDRLIVAGSSAGGGLAAATTLLAKLRGGPAIGHQMLFCPMLDDRAETASSQFEGVPWDRISNQTAWRSVLGERYELGEVDSLAAPARAEDLSDLPPAFLDVGSAEIFRDETVAYAARLLAAGVSTELHVWFGATHGFDKYAPQSEVARALRVTQSSFIARVVNGDA
jgi:acetyl esterase/lipase